MTTAQRRASLAHTVRVLLHPQGKREASVNSLCHVCVVASDMMNIEPQILTVTESERE